MSWYKKAATDDGGLNVSKVPPGALKWQLTRCEDCDRKPLKKRRKKKCL